MQKGINEFIRRLTVVLNDSNDAVTVQGIDGKILAWNKGAKKMYGYSEKEALNMNIINIIPNDQISRHLEYLKRIGSNEKLEPFETQRVTKDGRTLDISVVFTCLMDDSGVIDSVATTERDITGIKNELREKENEVKILKGLLPICSSCKKIRDSEGDWHQIESYIRDHSQAEFTHGLCPLCVKKLYPHLDLEKKDNNT